MTQREAVLARLLALQAETGIRGAILLGTCNRLEIILDVESNDADPTVLIAAILGAHEGIEWHDHTGAAATHYLLRVATGLESMVRGEEQILGQLREAFKLAERHGLLSPALRILRTQLTATARDTRLRTGMTGCKVSVASLATRQLEAVGRRFAIIGAGETGRLAIEALLKRGYTDLTVVNRTLPRAVALARHFGIEAMSLAEFLEHSEQAGASRWEAVLFAIDSPQPVFHARHAAGLRAIVDISMPSVLDPSIHQLKGVEICDLDTIAKLVRTETGRRSTVLDSTERIVEARATTLHDKLTAASRGKTAHFGQIIEQHLDTALNELQTVLSSKLSHLSNVDQEVVRQVILKATRRNAHFHLKNVRELSRS